MPEPSQPPPVKAGLSSRDYMRNWRKRNPHRYHTIMLKYYYKNRDRLLAMCRKPGIEDDEADAWLEHMTPEGISVKTKLKCIYQLIKVSEKIEALNEW